MIQQIAKNEVEKLHVLELGVIETVNIHEIEDDVVNYDCSVLLKGRTTKEGEPLKLENVPIATSHTGSVIIPYVDDLALLSFINGNFSMPVIIGRLYSVEKRSPLYMDGEHRITFDPKTYRLGDRDTATDEPLIDRRIIDFQGMPKEGEFQHEYLIRFKSGTVVRYDESTVDIVTNFLPKSGEDAEPGEIISHLRLQGVDKNEAKMILETGMSEERSSKLLGKVAKKISEMVFGSTERMAMISIHTKDADKSTILLERGDSKIEIDTERPSGKDKATITVRSGTSRIILQQDGNIEITSDEDIGINTGGDMNFTADGDMSFTGDNIRMESKKGTLMKTGKDLAIMAGTAMKVESSTDMEIKAGTAMKMEATTDMDIRAGMAGKMQASAALTIKGLPVQIN